MIPAYHVIRDVNALQQAIFSAQQAANDGYLVTLGDSP